MRLPLSVKSLSVKSLSLKPVLILFLMLGFSLNVSAAVLGLNFNPHQSGDSAEVEYVQPRLFKFYSASRHDWGFFASAGILTIYNTVGFGDTESKDYFNGEVIVGLFDRADFLNDNIKQYGKVALDYVIFDNKISSENKLGALLESGLEFESNIEKSLSIHIGLRWRFAYTNVDRALNKTDPVEGSSMVLGARWNLK